MSPARSVPAAVPRFASPTRFGALPVRGRAAAILPASREKLLLVYFLLTSHGFWFILSFHFFFVFIYTLAYSFQQLLLFLLAPLIAVWYPIQNYSSTRVFNKKLFKISFKPSSHFNTLNESSLSLVITPNP